MGFCKCNLQEEVTISRKRRPKYYFKLRTVKICHYSRFPWSALKIKALVSAEHSLRSAALVNKMCYILSGFQQGTTE